MIDNKISSSIFDDANDTESQRRAKNKLLRELGDVIVRSLVDPAVVEIMLNPDGLLWEDRHGVGMTQIGSMDAIRSLNLIGTIASELGLQATKQTPIVECELPLDGSRFEGLIPPLVERPIFAIRKKALLVYTLNNYLSDGILSEAHYEILQEHIEKKHNILVIGGTGTGKTTLVNAILQRISDIDPMTRIAMIEDTRELQCTAINKFPLRTSDAVDMTMLLRACMRLRPDRIVVGEVRDKSALALLKAWNTGHSGGVATVHANDAEAGLIRLEQLIEESGAIASKVLIAEAVNCVISIKRVKTGRIIDQISTVVGVNQNGYIFQTI